MVHDQLPPMAAKAVPAKLATDPINNPMRSLLLLVGCVIVSAWSLITEANKLHFGLDLHNGKNSIPLRARPGDNLSAVTTAFLAKHKLDPAGHSQIYNMLQDAGGAR